ncbi:hypothetical protein DdX_03758 [Ditylenchus destructor]|uniref:Uncharacterized protein n=1 Tax=Ditylenchus destructor TaxID=166010 RepID=A0AAD4RBJ9_9BILA|nr:hypothetical protein DdX_03758 [Ditylenchus destructor]
MSTSSQQEITTEENIDLKELFSAPPGYLRYDLRRVPQSKCSRKISLETAKGKKALCRITRSIHRKRVLEYKKEMLRKSWREKLAINASFLLKGDDSRGQLKEQNPSKGTQRLKRQK